jgi:hypothetical protein
MEVELLEGDGETTLRLSTRNRATPEYLRRAIELLTELKCAEDPLAYYDQLVRETAPKRGVSGLGLARIRAEGDLELYFAVEGDELRIWVEVAVDGSAQHIRSQNLQGQGAEAGEGTPSDEPPGSSTGAGEPTGSTTGEGT